MVRRSLKKMVHARLKKEGKKEASTGERQTLSVAQREGGTELGAEPVKKKKQKETTRNRARQARKAE